MIRSQFRFGKNCKSIHAMFQSPLTSMDICLVLQFLVVDHAQCHERMAGQLDHEPSIHLSNSLRPHSGYDEETASRRIQPCPETSSGHQMFWNYLSSREKGPQGRKLRTIRT